MSRIEEALEKALRLRNRTQQESPEPAPAPPQVPAAVQPRFEIRDRIIDPSRVDPRIVTITDPQSASAEQYRKLRARVLGITKDDFRNTILVTSSDVNEGKTVNAINLAVALAQELDHTVLLVDADLRNPSVSRYLGIDVAFGLSEYLAGAAGLKDILVHTGIGKLVLLPAGRTPDNPAELLASNRMKELVQELKFRYRDRYIIFDSTPLLVASDALPVARHVDGALLVIQAEKTTEAVSRKTMSLLGDIPIIGAVFNNVPDYLIKHLYPYYQYSYETRSDSSNGKGKG